MAKPAILIASSLLPAARTELEVAVALWHEAANTLAKAVEAEKAARMALADKYFAGAEEGTNTIDLSNGKLLKADIRINRKVDQAQYQSARVWATSNLENPDSAKQRKAQALMTDLDEVFKLKAELSVSAWKACDAASIRRLGDIVTETPGTPGMSLVDKK